MSDLLEDGRSRDPAWLRERRNDSGQRHTTAAGVAQQGPATLIGVIRFHVGLYNRGLILTWRASRAGPARCAGSAAGAAEQSGGQPTSRYLLVCIWTL